MVSTGSSSSDRAEAPPVDFVVAMPVFNQARTIAGAVRAGAAALERGFDGLRGELLIVDGGSTDNTPGVALAAAGDVDSALHVVTVPGHATEVIQLPYHGLPGRARALHSLFEAVRGAGARAVAVVDTAGASLTSDWIERLLQPALAGTADFVAPRYHRHPFDGALIKGIVAPVFRACFGVRLRQPMAPDFACSRGFVERTLGPGGWTTEAGDAGIDLWLAATAVSEGFSVCEAPLGPRPRLPRDDAPDLSATIAQVVGALFAEVDRRAATWHRTRGSRAVSVCGAPPEVAPEEAAVDTARLIERFRLGHRELAAVWSEILPPAAMLELTRLASTPADTFRLDDRLWARIIYDFTLGYRLRVIARDHLLGAMTPLYVGWLASFVLEARRAGASVDEVHARVEALGDVFESEKPYLISRWRWPERFHPSRY
jgi:hypothetical protein